MPLFTALARPFLILREALSVGEDYWTWRTLQDDVYEEVTLLKLGRKDVTIQHKYGVATIARADLPREIQNGLVENFEMSEPNESYGAIGDHEHFLHGMPLAHAK